MRACCWRELTAQRGSLLDLCLATAEGKMSKGELGGYTDIAIFKDGVTL